LVRAVSALLAVAVLDPVEVALLLLAALAAAL
jgi:hypothetical protein